MGRSQVLTFGSYRKSVSRTLKDKSSQRSFHQTASFIMVSVSRRMDSASCSLKRPYNFSVPIFALIFAAVSRILVRSVCTNF
jgi:hypothetical protein